jgi:hypothetical protein
MIETVVIRIYLHSVKIISNQISLVFLLKKTISIESSTSFSIDLTHH